MTPHNIENAARAFADELELNPARDTLQAILVRCTGFFSAGIAATAALALLASR